MREHRYFVYILSSRSRVLYVGVTRDLAARIARHREGRLPAFTARYRVDRLVYFEHTSDIRAAIAREKQIKGLNRAKKLDLVEASNPAWRDLLRPEMFIP